MNALPIGLVYMHAESLCSSRVEFDELVGEGMLAMVKAAKTFDKGANCSFDTWCGRNAKWAMLDYIRRVTGVHHRADRGPDGLPKSLRVAEVVSLDEVVASQGDYLHERHEYVPSGRDTAFEAEASMLLADVLALPESERYVMVRKAVGDLDREIADDLGVHRTNVTRLATAARRRLAA